MKAGSLSKFSPFGKLLITLVIMIASTILITFFALLITIPFYGFEGIYSLATGESSLLLIKYLQIVQGITLFIIPSFTAAYLLSSRPFKWLKFRKINWICFFTAIIIMIVAQPLSGFLAHFNMQMVLPKFLHSWEIWMAAAEANANTIIFKFLDTTSTPAILGNIFMIVLLPAFGEELLFRGVLQPNIKKIVKSPHIAVWITAFLFSAIHMQFFTFLPRFFLGALLGYLLVYGKNIWYPIVAHLINNLMALMTFYYYRITEPTINPLDNSGEQPEIWMVLASTLMLIGLFGLFRNKSKWTLGIVASRNK